MTANKASVVHVPEIGVTGARTKKPVGHVMDIKFAAAAHPPDASNVTGEIAAVVVNVMTGVTTVFTDRFAKGMDMDTAVTAVGLVTMLGVSRQELV